MTELNQNYKCNLCGNVVKIVQAGTGALVCCGQPMELVIETMPTQPVVEEAPVVEQTMSEVTSEPSPSSSPSPSPEPETQN